MRGRTVKERLKGKDSLREKRLRECQTEKKNREPLREGGRKGEKDTKGGRDKENRGGEGESDKGKREIQSEREKEREKC